MTDIPEFAGDEAAPTVAESAIEPAAVIATLQTRLTEAEAAAAASRDAHLRALADLDNVRKRAQREIESSAKYGAEKLLGELLGIADSLDLGLAAAAKPDAQVSALSEGMQITHKQLAGLLSKHGVSVVDPLGQAFNPDFHEAVTMIESADVPANHVLTVMQRGYKLHERLLRPAMVVVARTPAAS